MDDLIDHDDYATVSESEGVNYREIAAMMTELGFTMQHSSARNYMLRVMKKFANAFNMCWDLDKDSDSLTSIARSASFQHGIGEILTMIEDERHIRQIVTQRHIHEQNSRKEPAAVAIGITPAPPQDNVAPVTD